MPEQPGRPDQVDLLNSRPPQGDEVEDTRTALEQYREWEARQVAQYGVEKWKEFLATGIKLQQAATSESEPPTDPGPQG